MKYAKRVGLACGALALAAIGVDAATTGWLQSSGNYIYHDPANWVGGVVNNTFDSSLTLTGPLNLYEGPGYTVGGDWVFNFVQGNATADITVDGYAFNRPTLYLGGDLHFNPQPAVVGSLPTLSFGPNITVDLGGQARQVDVGAGAFVQTAYTGNFQNGSLIKTGVGELQLQGDNYLDSLEVRAGKLSVRNPNSLGIGPIWVTGPATLGFSIAPSDSADTHVNSITLAATTTLQGRATLSGPVNLGGGVRTLVLGVAGDSAGDATYTFSGVISNGSLDITEAAGRAGALTLSGANLMTGGTTITGATVTGSHPQAFGSGPIMLNAGAALMAVSKTGGPNLTGSNAIPNPIIVNADVTIGGSNVFTPSISEFSGAITLGNVSRTLTSSGSVVLSGPMTATGNAGLTIAAGGQVTLAGINSFPGGLTVNGGIVTLNRAESAGSDTLNLTGGAVVTLGDAVGIYPAAVIVNGSATLRGPSAATATFSGPVTLNGALTGSAVTLTGAVTVPGAGGQLASASTAGLLVQGVIGGPGQLTINTSSPVSLANANTHAGGTRLQAGTLFFSNKGAFGPGTLTIAGGVLAAFTSPLTGASAIANPIAMTGVFTLAPQVPVEFTGTVNLGGNVVGAKNALYGGSPVVTSFTGVMTGAGITWMGDGHVSLSGASTYTGPTTIANYVNLGASVLPNVPGPFGNASSQIALDITVLPPGGLPSLPANVAILNLQPGVTIGRSMRVVGGTISSSGGETFLTGPIAHNISLTIAVGAGGVLHLQAGAMSEGTGQFPVIFNGSGTALVESNIAAPVTVNAGRVLYKTTQTSGGGVSVIAGELGGTGTIISPVTVGNGSGMADAILGPGDGIGTLHTKAVTFASDGVFRLELDSTARTADLLTANGAVQLGTALLSPIDLGGSVLPLGLKFSILDNTSASATSGTFLNLADGALFNVGSNFFAIDYDAHLEADGVANDVTLTVVVPEPAGDALLGVGALIAGLARRRAHRRE